MSNYYNDQWRLPNNENKDKQSNYSMDFDGSSHINAGRILSAENTSTLSVSFWLKIPSTGAKSYLGYWYHPNGWLIEADASHVWFAVGNTAYNALKLTYSGNISVNVWYHIAMVFDGTQTGNANRLKVYLNGVPKTLTTSGSSVIPASIPSIPSAVFTIGGITPSTVNGAKSIDAVAIFDYALSQSQVTTLYGSSSTGIGNPMSLSPKPVAFYQLGDKSAFNSANYLVPNIAAQEDDGDIAVSYSPYALDFDGANDSIDIGSSIDVTGNTSFSYWFKANNTTQFGTVLDINSSSTTNKIWTGLYSGKIWAYTGTGNSVKTTTNYLANTWYHITVIKTSSASISHIYINGVAETLISDAGTFGVLTTGGRIGNQISYSSYYTGSISNCSIWNAALTSAQVTEIYNEGVPSNLNNHSAYSNLVS